MALSGESKVSLREHVSSPPQETAPQSPLTAIKQSPKILGYCLALASGILLFGYDLVIVGNVSAMPEFQRDFGRRLNGKLIIPSLWLGLWDVASPLGGLFGALTAGFMQDRVGRRFCLAFAGLLSAAAVAVAYVSNLPNDIDARRAVFLTAKLVQGLAIHIISCTTQTYMSEVLPAVLRGPILAFFPIFILLGQLVGSIVVYTSLDIEGSRGYRNCFISQWPFSALPLLVAVILPESPTYLIRKNRMNAARKSQRRLDSSDVESEKNFEQLRSFIEKENQDATSNATGYRDCFRDVDRRRTLIVMFANLISSFFGLPLLSKSSYFLQIVGMEHRRSFVFLQVGLGLGLVANILSMQTLTMFGRVPLIIASLVISAFAWMGMGIAGCFPGTVSAWYTGVTLVFIITVCGIGAWPASYAVGGETSSLRLRAKTQGLGWFVTGLSSAVFNLTLPYIFNPDEGALRGKTAFMFAALCIIAMAGTWFFVPEMKDRTPSEIDDMFEAALPARQFRKWSRTSGDQLSSEQSP
ncbi:MFS general substrate transporter [Aspergillus sclerotioniger CBS 115572]|uniref:MFS general substrate transporter n=1 Tax=Aspergillus sclerotioniger CBS 115572 TaxID=1450535 RepID=A0A317XCX8_9EURO|nr:MFS general substrate transporter [Aspergillus sclerotioniger CBS 115572]PWY95437.1 MFS general substrate transporter [Aspergillus sclerotioniger CBS 115572]